MRAPRQTAPGQAGRTAGTLRVFLALSELRQFPVSKPYSPQPPVTRAVGHLLSNLLLIMNHQQVFSEHVRKHFVYLLDDFGFSLVEDQYHQDASICVVNRMCKFRPTRAW